MSLFFTIDTNFSLVTDRLIITKGLVGGITSKYLKALTDPEVMQYTEARHNKWDYESVRKFIEMANQNNSILFQVDMKSKSKTIGNIRLFNWQEVHRRAEISFLFYDKSEWSNGYGTEAISSVLEFSKIQFNLHRVVADYYACNKASERLFSKLGFCIEGIFCDHFWLNGRYVDSIRVGKIL